MTTEDAHPRDAQNPMQEDAWILSMRSQQRQQDWRPCFLESTYTFLEDANWINERERLWSTRLLPSSKPASNWEGHAAKFSEAS